MRMVLFPTQLPESFMISRECLMMNGSVFPFRYLSQRRSPQQATEPSKRKIKSRHARAKHAAAAKCSSRTSQREPPETLARFKIRARPKIRTEGKKRRRAARNAALPAGGADGSGGSWNGAEGSWNGVRERE